MLLAIELGLWHKAQFSEQIGAVSGSYIVQQLDPQGSKRLTPNFFRILATDDGSLQFCSILSVNYPAYIVLPARVTEFL